VASAIDRSFRNTAAPTRTESEKAFMADFVSMLGNVRVFLITVGGAAAFAILCVAGSVVGLGIRERVTELGIMRVLGFSAPQLFGCLLAETSLTLTGGAVLGSCLAAAALAQLRAVSNAPLFADIQVSPGVGLLTCAVVNLLGLLTAIPPGAAVLRGMPATTLARLE
jgi:putative ABC transport system permease protein